MTPDLAILYEDNHCLAVSKPSGMATQAPPGIQSLEEMAKAYLRAKYHKKGRVYLGVPHRLDRPVSGVVLFARQSSSARRLAQQFQNRQVLKIYWGVVEGTELPAAGTWQDWLRKVKDQPRVEIVAENVQDARLALTHYRVLEPCTGGLLVEFRPETGRMHQLRIQAATRGCPIRGDLDYGARLAFGPAVEDPRERAIALHARSLTFLHPVRYEPITVSAPLPAAWSELGI